VKSRPSWCWCHGIQSLARGVEPQSLSELPEGPDEGKDRIVIADYGRQQDERKKRSHDARMHMQ
jgi:hypothetical protein